MYQYKKGHTFADKNCKNYYNIVWPLKYNKYPFAKQQKYAIFHLKNESKVLSKFST